eukprot:6465816-Amphidinium_carterae.1
MVKCLLHLCDSTLVHVTSHFLQCSFISCAHCCIYKVRQATKRIQLKLGASVARPKTQVRACSGNLL